MSHTINRRIAYNTFFITAGTLLSRLAGFVRDMLMARIFGVTWVAESFFVAFRIPNLLRELVGEGGIDSVAVPVLTAHRQELHKAQNQLLSLTLYVLCVIVGIGVLISKWLVIVIAPGFAGDPYRLALTVSLTRILFLFLFFSALAASLSTMLYTLKKFFVPALSPVLLNIAMIISLLLARGSDEFMITLLAYSVVVSGVVQLLMHYWYVAKEGYSLRFFSITVFKTTLAMKIGRLFTPRLIAVSVYQLDVFIDTVLSSFSAIVGSGAVGALYYANRIFQFPLALFSLAVARAMLPELSELKESDMNSFKRIFMTSLENVGFCVVPFACVFMFFSVPLIEAVFKRGTFDAYSVQITAKALWGYSFGLFFIASNRVFFNSFYALENTKTPARIAFTELCVNTVLSLLFMYPFKVAGITFASSCASIVSSLLLWIALTKKIGALPYEQVAWTFIKVGISSGIMCLSIVLGLKFLPIPSRLVAFCVVCVLGCVVYFLVCALLRVRQTQHLWQAVHKKSLRKH